MTQPELEDLSVTNGQPPPPHPPHPYTPTPYFLGPSHINKYSLGNLGWDYQTIYSHWITPTATASSQE